MNRRRYTCSIKCAACCRASDWHAPNWENAPKCRAPNWDRVAVGRAQLLRVKLARVKKDAPNWNDTLGRPMPMAMPGVDEHDYQRGTWLHRTGGQFYDLFPAYVGPGLASLAASFILVSGLCWWKTAPNSKSAPCRAIRRPLMRARRSELKPRAGRRTVRGVRRGAYPKTPRQNTVSQQ